MTTEEVAKILTDESRFTTTDPGCFDNVIYYIAPRSMTADVFDCVSKADAVLVANRTNLYVSLLFPSGVSGRIRFVSFESGYTRLEAERPIESIVHGVPDDERIITTAKFFAKKYTYIDLT